MSITIPAREVRKGDVIDLGGQPVVVAESTRAYRDDLWVLGIATELDPEPAGSYLLMPADAHLNVQRPDPDAELIEVMARAACNSFGKESNIRWEQFASPAQEGFRRDVRAALTAAREADLL